MKILIYSGICKNRILFSSWHLNKNQWVSFLRTSVYLCSLQVLQGNGVTISLIIPSLVGLDKTLESLVTNYVPFSKALRTGLHTHFQELISRRDVVLASVLDPRIKLQVLRLFPYCLFH